MGFEQAADESRRAAHLHSDFTHCHSAFIEFGDLVAIDDEGSATADAALAACFLQTSAGSLRDALVFLLRNPGGDSDHQLPNGAGRAEIGLGVADVLDAIAAQHFDVFKGFRHSLTRQAVERPGDEQVELPAGGGRDHALELLAVSVFAWSMNSATMVQPEAAQKARS